MKDICTIGTRGSALALAQANEVRDRLRKIHPRLSFEIKIIKTTGDKIKTISLTQSGTKGLFTKELEQALFLHKIDIAVHSLKDLPTVIPAGLALSAVPEREDPRDVLVYKNPDWSPEQGGTIASSSLRRQFQLLNRWPKLKTTDIRGNVETRLQKLLDHADWDAIVLAGAGLIRLGFLRMNEPDFILFESGPSENEMEVRKILDLEHRPSPAKPTQSWPLRYRWLNFDEMLPAPGQAALGIETRSSDQRTQSLVAPMNRFRSQAEVFAERAFLSAMGGGCRQPVAAAGRVNNEQLHLKGVVFSLDGKNRWEESISGPTREFEELGKSLAEKIKIKGAKL